MADEVNITKTTFLKVNNPLKKVTDMEVSSPTAMVIKLQFVTIRIVLTQ